MKARKATTRWMSPCHETGAAGTSVGNSASRRVPAPQMPRRRTPLPYLAVSTPKVPRVLPNA